MSLRSVLRAGTAAAAATVTALALASCAGAADADTAAGSDPSAGAAGPITVEHAQGSTELDGVPEKVFVYDYATLSVLEALDVPVAGVPKTDLPDRFAAYAGDEVTNIGTLFEPDYELVAAEQPDLIVVGGRSAAAYPELAKIAPTVDLSIDWTKNYESSVETAELLGEIFGAQDGASALVEELDAVVAATAEKAADAGTGLIALSTGGKVSAFGAGGRFGFLHDSLGVAPVTEITEEEQHGQSISFEFILDQNPDWLFVIDRDAVAGEGAAAAQEVFDNDLIKQTDAAKNDHIVYVDPMPWYVMGGGVVALRDIADEVGAVLDAAA